MNDSEPRRRRHPLQAAFAAALLALCTVARGDAAVEAAFKAAAAYNVIVLSTWRAQTPLLLRVCVAGAPVGTRELRTLAGKSAGTHVLLVEGAPFPANAAECHILFIPRVESRRIGEWLSAVSHRPTLTISDEAGTPGAMVNLRVAAGRVVFDVDTRAAADAGIGLSSQLIKLAATRR